MNNNTTHHNNPSSSQDFPIAIALLALLSIALLVVSYYIFIIKCCFNWHTLDPLRRFSFSRNSHHSHLTNFSTLTIPDIFTHQHRGLDEWLINNIPAFQYKPTSFGNSIRNSHSGERSFRSGCAVCLNEFQDQEMLRILPRCSHIFHLDCIDVWLLNNASCPLCRSSISGRTKYPLDHIIAPSSSPDNGYDPDYVVIEIDHNQGLEPDYATNPVISSQVNHKGSAKMKKVGKFQRFSIMGDECINVISNKDEQFCVQQPIRRSFSMDSVVDRGLYLQLQEMITRQSRVVSDRNHVNDESQGNGRVRRGSFFSFGSFRSSSVIPLESDR